MILQPELFDPTLAWTSQRIAEGPLGFDRLWRSLDNASLRLNVHRHAGAGDDTALFWHPHLTPVFIWILSGRYELRLGMMRADHGAAIPDLAVVHVDGPFYYEMTHPFSAHAIRVRTPGYSVMINAPSADAVGDRRTLTAAENEQVLNGVIRLFKER